MQSQCRRREIFWPGENKLHHRKACVYETICSRSLISRSFDSGPCEACLVSMRDNMLLLHSWDGRPYFILFMSASAVRILTLQSPGARKGEFLDCKLAAPVRCFRGFEPRFRVHLLRNACSFFVASFVVFNVLRFSLNRFFTLIAFNKKENAVPMQTA